MCTILLLTPHYVHISQLKVYMAFISRYNVYIGVFTFFGPTSVRVGSCVDRALWVLTQMILSGPVKHVTAILGEPADPYILKTTHMIYREDRGDGWGKKQSKTWVVIYKCRYIKGRKSIQWPGAPKH